MQILSIFTLCLFLIACNTKSKEGSSGSRSAPRVFIATDLEDITTDNLAHFIVSGTCSEEGQAVTVIVEDLSPKTAPNCTNGAWMTEIDLTRLTGPSREISITADHAIGHLNATQATGSALLYPRVFVATDLEEITTNNLAHFIVSGTCSEEGESITVSVGDVSATATCTHEAWMAEIDLTRLTGPSREISITADHAIGHLNATQATRNTLLHPRVFIATDLEEITTNNVDDFIVRGTCSEEGEPIAVSMGGVNPTMAPTCTSSGTWSTTVDLTRLTAGRLSITASHSTSNNLAALQATGSALLPPTVSVSATLANITALNANDFTVNGSCSENGQPVTVRVGVGTGTRDVSATLTCTSKAWTTEVDVTGLNKIEEVYVIAGHVSSDGETSAEAIESVANEFICPDNYVGVPALASYTTSSFCVMKYEAKNDGTTENNAISQASGTPYVSINQVDSITKCTGLNSDDEDNYDLMTNDEWQTLARNIELVRDNWATGVVGSPLGLNHGATGLGLVLAASSNDNLSCHETGQTCNGSTWHESRRTHTLSNGEVTWDVGGNASEWVKDTNSSNYGANAQMSQVTVSTHSNLYSLSGGTTTTARRAKDQFGPSGDYSNSTDSRGFGYGGLNYNAGGVIRGGTNDETDFSGIFTTALTSSQTEGVRNSTGFRCAYHP